MSITIQALLAFLLGVAITLAGFWIFSWRTVRYANRKYRDIIDLAMREAALVTREMRNQTQLDIEQRKAEADRLYNERESKVELAEEEISRRNKKLEEEEVKLQRRQSEAARAKIKAERIHSLYREKIEKLSRQSPDEIKASLRDEITIECSNEIMEMKREILGTAEANIKTEAQRILVDTLQRFASAAPSDLTATTVRLPNEEMKGRIIGREGRNIHSFEAASGTTLMIDETPESVLISSFDPVRREIARIALEDLVRDGRIHPQSIEAAVERAEGEMRENVLELGESAVEKLRLRNIHPEITQKLGELHFRLSNNQRTLEHSVEVAYFCSILASEVGADPDIAKRIGLFHDLGKALSQDYEGSHSDAAAQFLRSHGEDEVVVNAVEASHEEVEAKSIYVGLLKAADALSSTRPGARADSLEGYIQRIKSLEDIARAYDGVIDAYALRAGREIRIIVEPEKMADSDASRLARKIRVRIEEELSYPGSIKITVVRESRFHETAK